MLAFAYDYQLGLMTTLSLSAAHVFLELPLNVISIRGLVASTSADRAVGD